MEAFTVVTFPIDTKKLTGKFKLHQSACKSFSAWQHQSCQQLSSLTIIFDLLILMFTKEIVE